MEKDEGKVKRLVARLMTWRHPGMPTTALASLRSLRGVELQHNPWNCTCALRPVRAWLETRKLASGVPPLCLTPARLRGQSWPRLPARELACAPAVAAADALVRAAAGQPVLLACQVGWLRR